MAKRVPLRESVICRVCGHVIAARPQMRGLFYCGYCEGWVKPRSRMIVMRRIPTPRKKKKPATAKPEYVQGVLWPVAIAENSCNAQRSDQPDTNPVSDGWLGDEITRRNMQGASRLNASERQSPAGKPTYPEPVGTDHKQTKKQSGG